MSVAMFGSRECEDPARLYKACVQHELSVELWQGRANLYTCTAGREPGTGAVLLSRANLDAIGTSSDHFFTMQDEATKQKPIRLGPMTITRATCVIPASPLDNGQIYLVEFADRRHNLRRLPLSGAYNVVTEASATPTYLEVTTNSGTPYTWQELVTLLWNACDLSGTPTLPFTPHGTPQWFEWFGGNPWDALCDVLDRLACVADYDPIGNVFSVVRIASSSEEASALASVILKPHTLDGAPKDGDRATYPQSIVVRFRILPAPADGLSPFREVTLSLPSGSGVVSDTVVTIEDDLVVSAAPDGSELAIIAARAAERKDDWVRKYRGRDRRILKTFRDLNSEAATIQGGAATRATWEDRGNGARTEIVSGPDYSLEKLRFRKPSTGGGADPSIGGCTPSLTWLLDTESLQLLDVENGVFPRAMVAAMVGSYGRCSCIAAPAGDSGALRFYDAIRNPLTSPYAADPWAAVVPIEGDTRFLMRWDRVSVWEGLGNFATCCSGCAIITLGINGAATLLLGRAVLTMTIYKGCKDSSDTNPANPPPKTITLYAECGNDGYMILGGMDTQACQYKAVVSQCVNLFRMILVCTPCNLPDVGCIACAEHTGPPVYKAVAGGRVYYLRSTGNCGCEWQSDCGSATLTVAGTTVTLVTSSGTYVYDTEDTTPGCNRKPPCWAELTLSSGEDTAVITPKFCDYRVNTGGELCIEDTPDLFVSISVEGCATKTGMMPYDAETGYSNGSFVFGDCVGCVPIEEQWTFTLACTPSTCGGFTWTITLAAPTGDSIDIVIEVISRVPLYLKFSGTLRCQDSEAGTVLTPFTGYVSQLGSISQWFCVDGNCVQTNSPPTGALGPFPSAASCANGCGCEEIEGFGLRSKMAKLPIAAQPIVAPSREKCRFRSLDVVSRCDQQPWNESRHLYDCAHEDNPTERCTRNAPTKSGKWTCETCQKWVKDQGDDAGTNSQ